jgi:hypothetical protein
MSREIDGAIAEARRAFQRLRSVAGTGPASPTTSPAAAPVAHPTAPAPSDTWRPPAPARAQPNPRPPRPPAHYLKGPPEPYEAFIGPGGEISPTPFGTWWGPI